MRRVAVASTCATALAQQAGTLKTNYHMPISVEECSASGCVENGANALTLDANWRWTHSASGSQNCYTGNEWDSSLCPNGEACAKNCALGAVPESDWQGTIGVHQTDAGVKLDFVTQGPYSKNVGSRLYVLEGEKYKMFKMLNREISMEVDVSQLPCGLNGAIYFVEMAEDGNMGGNNAAGPAYGTGYCDGQCPRDVKFIQGKANIENWTPSTGDPWGNSGTGNMGACCAEMDLWEANSMATAVTPHPDEKQGLFICEGDAGCGSQQGDRTVAPTDRSGCDLNAYRTGVTDFYGPGSTFQVDTTKPFTVVTAFHTSDGSDSGTLSEITQWYIQDNKRIDHPNSKVSGLTGNNQTPEYCKEQKIAFGDDDDFDRKGGLENMGEALGRGMVLTLSLWDDIAVSMNWLDSIGDASLPEDAPGNKRGPCDPSAGKPETVRTQHPDSSYTVGRIKVGSIGSTNPQFPDPTPSPAPVPTPPTPVPTPTPTPSPSPGCPGGSLHACIAECPTTPTSLYQVCVNTCLARCSSALI